MAVKGQIVKTTGSWCKVLLQDGGVIDCRLPGKLRLGDQLTTNPVAAGDFVSLKIQDDQTGIISGIDERKTVLERKATHGRRGTQIMAANVDRIVVVQSFRKPAFKTGFIDRLLVYSEWAQVPAILVLNKYDLHTGESDRQHLASLETLYQSLGYSVLFCSALSGYGMQELHNELKNKTSVLSGPSGTGKTSLVNALYPGLNLKIGDVSTFSNKGKHTTTYAQLLSLPDGINIVDTPGIREFGLSGLDPSSLSHYFPEMVPFLSRCRYSNCTHRHEPSCGVKEALRVGEISESRYKSYMNMADSALSEEH